ncbi:MAG: PKD domain-containing protein [Pseudomonadota bacterium]
MRQIKTTGLMTVGILKLLLLTGCGGGASNVAPIANAGAARTVDVGGPVTLNGTGSTDSDGTIASYAWTQTGGTPVTLNNATTSQPNFIAPQGTVTATLTFQLIVTDNGGATGGASTTITVNGNAVPVANAGAPQTVASGAAVTLNGGASSDADGTIASYSWTQTAGGTVTLGNPTSSTPGFTAPVGLVASTLTYQLIVKDNRGVPSTAASVTITVNANVAPVAIAGPPQSVQAGAAVTLNGTASSDSDGTIVAYAWTQTAGVAVTLNNASTSTPSFAAPVGSVDSTLTFRLIVTDNAGAVSAASTVTVTAIRNFTPAASAGSAQTVSVGSTVTLDGTASTDFGGGSIAGYAWTQISGPAVILTGASTSRPTFTAPGAPTTLIFSLVVTDNFGAISSPSTVTITVNPTVTMSGVVRFQRVPFLAGSPFGLDYANPVWQPARGITVNATMTSGTVVGIAVTDSNGNYSISVPSNLNINIRAVAQMLRDSAQPLPRWNIRVKDGLTPDSYFYFNGTVNSSAGTYNVDIPSGIAANGTRTTASSSSSGPFAILDTIYTAIQTVLGVAPNTNFPALYVDWGSQTEGTFFTTQNSQHIALLADVTQDTDEYDQHVVAHEFGHYIEENFSRSDSIGGSHSLGQKLDMRVAFGEGFGSAFAAIVLNDPFVRDSFVSGGTQVASRFNVETNPSGPAGCWCSETSVWSILWDLYDNVPDGSDNISLPFSAIWDVLINPQRLTPSVTSIFSFTSALKTAQPAFAGLIDSLVSAQNTNPAAIDAFATSETFLPFPGMTLPLIPSITRGGGPVTVRSVDDGGHYNKAGNRVLLRFTAISTGAVTVSLTTSNLAFDRDPDFFVWNNGTLFWGGVNSSAEYPETETFSVTAGQTYIIDAYDCANGCAGTTVQGTPGDYDLTVTIN